MAIPGKNNNVSSVTRMHGAVDTKSTRLGNTSGAGNLTSLELTGKMAGSSSDLMNNTHNMMGDTEQLQGKPPVSSCSKLSIQISQKLHH